MAATPLRSNDLWPKEIENDTYDLTLANYEDEKIKTTVKPVNAIMSKSPENRCTVGYARAKQQEFIIMS